MTRSAGVTGLEPLFIDAKAAAALFGISERTWQTWNSTGVCPGPVRFRPFGRSVRWGVDDLRAWAAAGMPKREDWRRTLDTRSL